MALGILALSGAASADVVADWNRRACAIARSAGADEPRVLGVVRLALVEGMNSIDPRFEPHFPKFQAKRGASVAAALAAASRGTLVALVPSERAAIESAYEAAIAPLPHEESKRDGILVGERAAALALAYAEPLPDLSRIFAPCGS